MSPYHLIKQFLKTVEFWNEQDYEPGQSQKMVSRNIKISLQLLKVHQCVVLKQVANYP